MPNIQNETEVPGGGDRDMAERLARSLFGMKIDGDLLVTLKDGNDYLYPLESISDDLNAEKISLTTFDENGQAKSSYGICTRMEPDETFDEYLKATFVLRVGHRRTAIWLFDEKLDLNGDGADKFVTLSKMFRVPAEHEAHMVPLFWRAKTGFRRSQSPDDLIKLVRTYWPNGKPELKEKALKAPEGGKPYNYHNVFSFGDADDGEDLLRKTVKLTFGTKISSNDWKTYENEFDDVMPLLLEHNVGTEYGRSFLQGVLVDGANQRSSKNMQENYVLALDIDTGEPLESMRRKIWGDCLFAVIYTRHSHGSTETAVKSEEVRNYFKCNDRTPIDGDIELEHVVEFLRDQKRYWPTILENAKWVAEKDIEGGIHCVISHNPMDKYCVVFVLDKPFVFAEREGDHTEAIQEWKERYARLAGWLDVPYDQETTDPARLFFLPRHDKGAEFRSDVIFGYTLLDLDTVPRIGSRQITVDEIGGNELEDEHVAEQEGSRFASKLTYPPRKKMTPKEHIEWYQRQLQEINDEFAIVAHNNKQYVLREPKGPSTKKFHFWTLPDLRLYFSNCPIMVKTNLKKSKNVTEDAYKAWIEWPKRREFAGIEFQPDLAQANPKFFNTFRGFATEPDSNGSWSELRQHLKSTICHDNEEWFHWVMTWLAHIVQKPGEKINTCLVIRGAQGTGKSTLGEFIIEMLGDSVALMVDDPSAITGDFTGQLSGKLFILDEEATFAGNPQAAAKLKSKTAGKFIYINEKFISGRMERNLLRIMKLTNEDWAVPKERDDRRYTVLEIKPDHAQDLDYFAAIHDQMNNQGGLQAMMHELVHWQPSEEYGGWNCIRTPLQTIWGEEQTEMSADLLDMFITEFLEKGEIHSPKYVEDLEAQPYIAQGGGNPFIKPGDLHKHYLNFCRENAGLGRPPAGSTRTPVTLMKRLSKRLKMEKIENTSRTVFAGPTIKGTIYEIIDPEFGPDK